MNCQSHLYRNCHPRRAGPPLVPEGMRRRASVAIALAELMGPACGTSGKHPGSARAEAQAIFRRRPRASSICSWPARRAIWSCSTTSRSWRSSTARCRRPNLLKGYRAAFINPNSKLLGPKFKFAKHGQSGAELSELLPHLAAVVDDIAIVKSMVTDAFNHAPAQILMNTGSQQFGRPSIGLVGHLRPGQRVAGPAGLRRVFSSGKKGPAAATRNWGSGFLPTVYQGVPFRGERRPGAVSVESRAASIAKLQRDSLDARQRAQPAASGRSRRSRNRHAHQLASRWRTACNRARPELMDISQGAASTCSRCTAPSRASRRSPTTACWPGGWSSAACGSCSSSTKPGTSTAIWCTTSRRTATTPIRPCAALVKDLKQRGLLDDTLVIWGGEFGRTPMVQGAATTAATIIPTPSRCGWPAAASSRGVTLGETDDFGFNVVEDRVHVHDLHATILHLLGFDHQRLTFKFQGLDAKLTGVEPARVVRELLA